MAETPPVEQMHDHGFTVAREDLWAACTEMQRDVRVWLGEETPEQAAYSARHGKEATR